MRSLDLSDAYYSISINPEWLIYVKFRVGLQLYKCITLPNGLSSAPRIFTKLPVYSTLQTRGHISRGYLDDRVLLFQDRTEWQLQPSVSKDVSKINVNQPASTSTKGGQSFLQLPHGIQERCNRGQ